MGRIPINRCQAISPTGAGETRSGRSAIRLIRLRMRSCSVQPFPGHSMNKEAESVESVISRTYALISGRTTEPRDWSAWKALHAPDARLIPIENAEDGSRIARTMTPDEFAESRSKFFLQHDFFEWETAREERRYGRLAHVWSTYEAAHEPGGRVIRKGVNSFQLWNDGNRWWILSAAWDAVEALEQAR